MKKYLLRLTTFLLLVQLTACGWLWGDSGYFRDRQDDYNNASSQSRILIPNHMSVRPVSPKFEVKGDKPDSAKLLQAVPKPSTSILFEQYGTRLRRDGGKERLVFQPVPKHLPLIIEEFLGSTQVSLNPKLSDESLWVTEWGTYSDEDESRGFWGTLWYLISFGYLRDEKIDYYRFKFEWGPVEPRIAYFDVSYQKRSVSSRSDLSNKNDGKWMYNGSEDSRVAAFLNELVSVVDDYRVSVQYASKTEGGVKKSIEVDGNGYPVLILSQGYARAWENLLLSLVKSRIEVEDLDRSLGLFFIRVPETLAAESGLGEEQLVSQVRVVRVESGVLVSVQETEEKLVSKELGSLVLQTLYQYYP